MSLVNLSVKHGQTIEEARAQLEKAVTQVRTKFGAMITATTWSPDGNSVKLSGTGFEINMRVDPQDVLVTADVPFLNKLLSGPLASGLKSIVEQTFQKRLPK